MEMRFNPITRAKLVLTNECQLRCKYCYENHGVSTMSLDTAKSVIDLVKKNADEVGVLPSISFFGGEPLLVYEELMKPCIEYIRSELKCRFNIAFTTNGLLLDEDKLKYFREMNVDFMLSIDGCPESHDTNRVYINGSGSSSDLEKNIPSILKYFPNTRARVTITPETVQYLYKSVKYIADLGFLDLHIAPDIFILPNGRKWEDSDFEVLKNQMSQVEEYIIQTFEDYEVPLIPQTLMDMFPRIVLSEYCRSVGRHRTATCCIPEERCGIGVAEKVVVDVDGSIYACQHGADIEDSPLRIGNIRDGISEEARRNLYEMNLRPLESERLDCSECPLDNICTGGCVPNNYMLFRDFSKVPTAYCLWTRQLYSSALNIIHHFDEKKDNDLFKDYFYGVVKRGVVCVC